MAGLEDRDEDRDGPRTGADRPRAGAPAPDRRCSSKHGTISYAKVRALTRVATPEREAELLEFARAGSAAKLERTVRMWKKLSRDAELTAEQARRRSRTFSVFVDGDGMYVVKGRLEPEVGADADAGGRSGVGCAVPARGRSPGRGRKWKECPSPGRAMRARSRSSAVRMRWGCWPSGRWPRGLGRSRVTTQAGRSRHPPHRTRHSLTKTGRHPTARDGRHPTAKARLPPTEIR